MRGVLRAVGVPKHYDGVRSSEGALSPGMIGQHMSDFNINDYRNEFEQ